MSNSLLDLSEKIDPPLVAVLKVIAWSERTPRGDKDAGDLDFLMRNYMDAGNQERLAEEHADMLADDNFDYERAGAQLLGRDMAKVMTSETRKAVLGILDQETGDQKRYRLVEDMTRGHAGAVNAFEECLQFLEVLTRGIKEG